jgi:hypothetical protein
MLSVLIALPPQPDPRSRRIPGAALRTAVPRPVSKRVDDAAHVLTAMASVGGGYDQALLRRSNLDGAPAPG